MKRPEDIDFLNEDKIIGINLVESNCIPKESDKKIRFKFNSFKKPSTFIPDELNIAVDHSFEFDENLDNIIFIDHHLVEQLTGVRYKSNSDMMVKNYKLLYNVIKNILDRNKSSNITIWMHSDIDGLCSGIIMKKILIDVSAGKMDNNYEQNLKMAHIIGNYGDIDSEAKLSLTDIFSKESEIDIFDKKVSSFCKSLSRFMKATRAVYDDLYAKRSSEIITKMESRLKSKYIDINSITSILILIDDLLNKLDDIDVKRTLVLFNILAQNKIINLVLSLYNEEIAELINNYIEPTNPVFEMQIIFKEDPTKTQFKLLIIDSPFDCGRSVIWKYRSNLNIFLKKCGPVNQWKFRISDWSKDRNLIDMTKNMICYNRLLNKLSLDGDNSSSYNIAKTIFDGGGHLMTEDGRSLGSVVINNESDFFDSFVLVDFF